MSTENANAPETVNPRKSRFKVPPVTEQPAVSEQPAPPAIPVPEHSVELASAAPTLEGGDIPQTEMPPNVIREIPDPAHKQEPQQFRTAEPGPEEQNAMHALMSGKVAVVPVEWLERMLSPAQVQQALSRRTGRSARGDTAAAIVHGEPKNPKMKFCPGCSLEKTRAVDFYKMSTSKDGYQPRCKMCQLEASRIRKAERPKSRGLDASRAGLYMLNGKARDTVRGRDTIKRVYAYFKRHKKGVTAKQIQSDLKMPASTVHWTLAKLQEKRAVRSTAA